ncbi:hypothetical protein V6N13_069246 [Hibiscus sabdariffa]
MPDSTGVPSEECTESLPSQVHKSGSLRIVPCCLQQSFCPAGQPTGQPLEVEADISCSPQTKMENRGEHISESILLADGNFVEDQSAPSQLPTLSLKLEISIPLYLRHLQLVSIRVMRC